MKTKKFHKRLTLNKKTIADLNSNMMGNVHGGEGITDDASCYVHPTDCPDCTAPTCATCNTCATYCGTCETCDTCWTDCATCLTKPTRCIYVC